MSLDEDMFDLAQDAFDAGFAAALSEHEQVGWYDPDDGGTMSLQTAEFRRPDWSDDQWLADGYERLYRRSVEVESSEVPRTPEEPT